MAKHVVAVDDEANIRRLVEINLKRAGYRVTTACDGVDALAKIRADRPDLVLLDLMMPQMDGFEVLRQLKADPVTAAIPVVLVTVQMQDASFVEGWSQGAADYLTKPFSLTDLLAVVQRYVGAGGEEA